MLLLLPFFGDFFLHLQQKRHPSTFFHPKLFFSPSLRPKECQIEKKSFPFLLTTSLCPPLLGKRKGKNRRELLVWTQNCFFAIGFASLSRVQGGGGGGAPNNYCPSFLSPFRLARRWAFWGGRPKCMNFHGGLGLNCVHRNVYVKLEKQYFFVDLFFFSALYIITNLLKICLVLVLKVPN